MFHHLKQKQAQDRVPNLISDKGEFLDEPEDNLEFVFNFYNNIFGTSSPNSDSKTNAKSGKKLWLILCRLLLMLPSP